MPLTANSYSGNSPEKKKNILLNTIFELLHPNTLMDKKIHHGRNIKRFREMLGIKQDALAYDLGDDWNQKKVSLLETKEEVDPAILEQIARVFKVPTQAIENFDEEQMIYNISCNFSDNAVNNNAVNIQNINPVDKWLEALEENKKLYERLLQAEREKNELLQKMLEKK